ATDVAQRTVVSDQGTKAYIATMRTVGNGVLEKGHKYALARGALTLVSASLLSRNDGSVITTGENRLVGMAQYAGFGRAYVFPAAVLRDKVAKRVLAKRGSVAAGWLGAMGESLAAIPEPELAAIGLPGRNGVLVREVSPQGPAALAGLLPNDVIVGLDTAE